MSARRFRHEWLVCRRWHGVRFELLHHRDQATARFRAHGFLLYLGLPGLLVVISPRSGALGHYQPRRSRGSS